MEALNEVVLHKDIELILKLLQRLNVKLSQILDKSNNTILHSATYAGRLKLVKLLLKYMDDTNDDPNFKNIFQQTPQQLAEAGGHTSIANLFRQPVDHANTIKVMKKGDRESVTKFEQLNWEKYLVSGWNTDTKSLAGLSSSYPPLCSHTLPIVDQMSDELQSLHEPLLVKDMETSKWNAWKNWRKKDIIERYC